MAAAYAALVSLLNTMHQIESHHLLSTSFNNYPNESLREMIDFLLHFVENYSDADSCGEAEDLVRRIAVLAREAENIIEVHAVYVVAFTQNRQTKFLHSVQRIIDDIDSIKEQIIKETGNHHQLLLLHLARYLPCLVPLASGLLALLPPPASLSSSAPPSTPMVDNYSESEDLEALDPNEIMQVQPADPICDQKSPGLLPDMQNTKEDMCPIKKKAKEETGSRNQHPLSSSSSTKTTKMVGFDGYLDQLLDQLTGQPSHQQILPIVGMGGIGKTTLARNVYDNLLIVEHFFLRVWVTVSQEFSASGIILQSLSCLGRSTSETDKTDDQLGEELHQVLFGRKYLIVLDDVWSVEAWEKIKFFFPENNNGSRILITTRQSELVGYFGSSALFVNFLDDENSWELLCEKTFPQQDCPLELVEIGKKIVVNCKGFPLAIVVVGGFLRKSHRTLKYWEEIAKDKSLILNSGEGNNASDILYLSYKHLPVRLKPCFLYFGLFPEDYSIKVSKLIKLWVAEGFIKSNSDQSLEEVAENYVNELVDRNLVLVGSLKLNKKLKTCLVHDLVRDLCLRLAEKENFYCVQRDIFGDSHIVVAKIKARFYQTKSPTPSLVHRRIFDRQRVGPSNSRLLRVSFSDGITRNETIQEVNLRLLICEYPYNREELEIPPAVSLLWSLQTLIVTNHGIVRAPCEIWEMPQLRHINISMAFCLPDPPPSDNVFILHNLQTLTTLTGPIILSKEVCKRIPNIKKLGIHINMKSEVDRDRLHNVGLLNKLESLRCDCFGYGRCVSDSFRNLKWPSSLKKLTLKNSRLEWRDMGIIGALPHLQILKLLDNAVIGAEWNCVEGEFVSLKHLEIRRCELTFWIGDSSNFPVLETLSLNCLSELEEIPSDIGNVPTLENIRLFSCNYSAAFSAVKILEEQESLGYQGLQVRITFIYMYEAVKLREKIKELDITCRNLLIHGTHELLNHSDSEM